MLMKQCSVPCNCCVASTVVTNQRISTDHSSPTRVVSLTFAGAHVVFFSICNSLQHCHTLHCSPHLSRVSTLTLLSHYTFACAPMESWRVSALSWHDRCQCVEAQLRQSLHVQDPNEFVLSHNTHIPPAAISAIVLVALLYVLARLALAWISLRHARWCASAPRPPPTSLRPPAPLWPPASQCALRPASYRSRIAVSAASAIRRALRHACCWSFSSSKHWALLQQCCNVNSRCQSPARQHEAQQSQR